MTDNLIFPFFTLHLWWNSVERKVWMYPLSFLNTKYVLLKKIRHPQNDHFYINYSPRRTFNSKGVCGSGGVVQGTVSDCHQLDWLLIRLVISPADRCLCIWGCLHKGAGRTEERESGWRAETQLPQSLLLKCITAFLGSLQNSSRHGASNWITTGHFEGES